MQIRQIPFNRHTLVGNEMRYISECLESDHISGDGPFSRMCEEFLQARLGVPKALLTTSGTHALEMAAFLLEIKPGDEFIVSPFTFVSSAGAFTLRGGSPVFIDIRQDTLNMDENQLESLVTSRTRAIVPVHYAGVGCEMEAIMDIAGRHDIPVVEDNSHGLFAKYKNKPLGTFGGLAAQSFHETKNLTSGEGGALLLNDPKYIERSEIIREKGTNRSQFFRGQVDKYTWVDVGSSYVLSDILAAHLFAQLDSCDAIQAKRKQIWNYYHKHLSEWARGQNIRLPVVPSECEQSYHMFYLILPTLEERSKLIGHLKSRGISSAFHYPPLHLSHMALQLGGLGKRYPVAEYVSDRLLRLPFYNSMNEDEQAYVVNAIIEFKVG